MAFGKIERSVELATGPPAAVEECPLFGPRDESRVHVEGTAQPLPARESGDQLVTTAFRPRVGSKGVTFNRCTASRPPHAVRLPEAAC
jgi:hypothetical protein